MPEAVEPQPPSHSPLPPENLPPHDSDYLAQAREAAKQIQDAYSRSSAFIGLIEAGDYTVATDAKQAAEQVQDDPHNYISKEKVASDLDVALARGVDGAIEKGDLESALKLAREIVEPGFKGFVLIDIAKAGKSEALQEALSVAKELPKDMQSSRMHILIKAVAVDKSLIPEARQAITDFANDEESQAKVGATDIDGIRMMALIDLARSGDPDGLRDAAIIVRDEYWGSNHRAWLLDACIAQRNFEVAREVAKSPSIYRSMQEAHLLKIARAGDPIAIQEVKELIKEASPAERAGRLLDLAAVGDTASLTEAGQLVSSLEDPGQKSELLLRLAKLQSASS